jgi:peptidoglycan/LPS O-acetylase OafA/YrhL
LLLTGLLWLRRRHDDPFRPIVAVAAAAALGCLVLRVGTGWMAHKYSNERNLFPTHLRLDSLLFGVAISYAYHFHHAWFEGRFSAHRRWLILAGCASLLPAFWFPLETSPWIYIAGLTLFSVGSGALLTGVLLSPSPEHRVAVGLGLLGAYSYSIYLWHMPVIAWVIPGLERLLSRELDFLVRFLLYIIGSLVVGIMMARLIEIPALRLRDAWFPSRGAALPEKHACQATHQTGTSRNAESAFLPQGAAVRPG